LSSSIPQWGYWTPAFFIWLELGMKSQVRMKIVHMIIIIFKQGTKLVFSAKLILQGISPPLLNLPYLCLHCHTYYFLIKPLSNKILQIFSTDTQFNKMECKLGHFTATLGLGMKHELEGQTTAQRQVHFTHNPNTISLFCSLIQ
jgi:hypothetical protein